MARSSKGLKILGTLVLTVLLLTLSAGVILYLLTRPIDIEFANDPNPLEAHEANRKLKLLTDAREHKRLGFVRLNEVEINSFLDESYNNSKKPRTNSEPVYTVRSKVLLHQTNLTFITWMRAPVAGIELPLVWQRTVTPVKDGDHWSFQLTGMQLGKMNIPELLWKETSAFLGTADQVFDDRKEWLTSVPKVTLVKNELSATPELRLYSYQPTNNKSGL